MPKEKKTQDHAHPAQFVLGGVDSVIRRCPRPGIKSPPYARIVSDKQNGYGNQHVGTSLHQSLNCLLRIRFSEKNKSHYRVPPNLDPAFERHERIVRPSDRNKAIDKKSHQPAIVPKNVS